MNAAKQLKSRLEESLDQENTSFGAIILSDIPNDAYEITIHLVRMRVETMCSARLGFGLPN